MEDKQRSSRWTPLCTELRYYNPLMAGSIDGTDKVAHDRGVVRAMTAKCKTKCYLPTVHDSRLLDKPNKRVKGRPEATIFVARLNHMTTEGLHNL